MARFGRVRVGTVAGSAALALALVAALHPLTAAGRPASQAPAPASVPAVELPTGTVTLVTGDRVTVGRGPDGAPNVSVEQVRRPDGREPGYRTELADGRLSVLPADVLPYLNAGVLDRALFDIGLLLESGASAELPLVVRMPTATARGGVRAAAEALPGAVAERSLESLDAAGVRLPAGQADDFWTALASTPPAPSLRAAVRLGRGVTGVWLDRKLSATLDESVPRSARRRPGKPGTTVPG